MRVVLVGGSAIMDVHTVELYCLVGLRETCVGAPLDRIYISLPPTLPNGRTQAHTIPAPTGQL